MKCDGWVRFVVSLLLHPNAAQLVGIFGCVGYTKGRHRGRVDTSYHIHSWTKTKNRTSYRVNGEYQVGASLTCCLSQYGRLTVLWLHRSPLLATLPFPTSTTSMLTPDRHPPTQTHQFNTNTTHHYQQTPPAEDPWSRLFSVWILEPCLLFYQIEYIACGLENIPTGRLSHQPCFMCLTFWVTQLSRTTREFI